MSEGPVLVVEQPAAPAGLIVTRLVERGIPTRALVRDVAKGRDVLPPEVRQDVGDVRHGETLGEALAGARAVIIATCSSGEERGNDAETVDYYGTSNLIEQAAAAGVERVLFVSSIHVTRPEHLPGRGADEPGVEGEGRRGDPRLRDALRIVRSGWLTDGAGGEPLVVSQGDSAEGRISRADLADVCTQLLSLRAAIGKTFEVIAAPAGERSSLASAVAALEPDAEAGRPV